MNFKITIPKPCHEDWQKMTPTQKGAFCKVCSKEVKDFTKSTQEQIEKELKNATGNTCSKFKNSQLDHSSINSLFRNWKIPLAATFALLVTGKTAALAKVMGEVALPINKKTSVSKGDLKTIQTISNQSRIKGKIIISESNNIKGDVDYTPVEKSNCSKPPKTDTTQIIGDTILKTMDVRTFTLGMMVTVTEKDTLKSKKDSLSKVEINQTDTSSKKVPQKEFAEKSYTDLKNEENKLVSEPIKLKVFPNPSSAILNIKLSESGLYNIQINDSFGKLVLRRSFFGDTLRQNIASFPNGNYIVSIFNSEGKLKVSKAFIKN